MPRLSFVFLAFTRPLFFLTLYYPFLLQLWAFEHLPWLAPRKGQRPLEFPAGRRWGWKKKLTVRPPPDTVWDLIRDGNPEHVQNLILYLIFRHSFHVRDLTAFRTKTGGLDPMALF